ncbi:MAG: spore coat protein U domain-containing protein [Thiobacillus sp.]|uniref:spore coat protein U domain-containing protein n=1 Tax=Thiobacillus sp. TaxID=924 RepID=UPI002895935D|nr:spore coat protein U domain-containing protein [Thiobacillus sp.]MDT3705949.1 spore coat protein U domain-containing protein [Thiobacillus sp.]
MKKMALAAFMTYAGLIGMSTHAATATGNFDVNLTLTSKCEINGAAAPTGAVITNLDLIYTSFQTTDATATTNLNVRCTDGLSYSLGLDNTTVTDDALKLQYTLALSSTSGAGNGTDQPFTVTGTIAKNQAGTCTSAFCTNSAATNKQRTLTVTY